MPERFPPPWFAKAHEGAYVVYDADGCAVAWVYFEDRPIVGTHRAKPSRDQARRIASNIAKLPALLLQTKGPGEPGPS